MAKPALPVASERAEQAALFAWLRIAAPPGLFYSALPGGDGRETRAPGYRAGLPDCLLIWMGRAILIEMKRTKGGRLDLSQQLTHGEIKQAGGIVVVAAGWEEAADFLCTVVPMRDTRAQRIAVRA